MNGVGGSSRRLQHHVKNEHVVDEIPNETRGAKRTLRINSEGVLNLTRGDFHELMGQFGVGYLWALRGQIPDASATDSPPFVGLEVGVTAGPYYSYLGAGIYGTFFWQTGPWSFQAGASVSLIRNHSAPSTVNPGYTLWSRNQNSYQSYTTERDRRQNAASMLARINEQRRRAGLSPSPLSASDNPDNLRAVEPPGEAPEATLPGDNNYYVTGALITADVQLALAISSVFQVQLAVGFKHDGFPHWHPELGIGANIWASGPSSLNLALSAGHIFVFGNSAENDFTLGLSLSLGML